MGRADPLRQRQIVLELPFRQMAGGTGDLAIGTHAGIEEQCLAESCGPAGRRKPRFEGSGGNSTERRKRQGRDDPPPFLFRKIRPRRRQTGRKAPIPQGKAVPPVARPTVMLFDDQGEGDRVVAGRTEAMSSVQLHSRPC